MNPSIWSRCVSTGSTSSPIIVGTLHSHEPFNTVEVRFHGKHEQPYYDAKVLAKARREHTEETKGGIGVFFDYLKWGGFMMDAMIERHRILFTFGGIIRNISPAHKHLHLMRRLSISSISHSALRRFSTTTGTSDHTHEHDKYDPTGHDYPSMVKYIDTHGVLRENGVAGQYLTIVGTLHSHEPFNMVEVRFHGKHEQPYYDAKVLAKARREHTEETKGGIGVFFDYLKWGGFMMDAMIERHRTFVMTPCHDVPHDISDALEPYKRKPIIVTDIDGTLKQMIGLALDGPPYVPAREYLKLRASQGYTIVYLTARGVSLGGMTRNWLHDHSFPHGPLFLSNKSVGYRAHPDQQAYKSNMLVQIPKVLESKIVEAFGDQDSDVEAYKTIDNPDVRIGKVATHTVDAVWRSLE
eukprot:TRINITY_DN7297_c0_g1_i2.p1 TRINITY_DN7297_c0_g1~~TRINITY_DN7297_c0_g1_i2.p1  ORF type:complete len:410 (+),score=53.81 TRINITY_DN7297_c0_g1_i2:279-1508(+)